MSSLLEQLVIGLNSAAIYALIAIGISLVFGLTGLINFAHGDLVALAGYITFAVASGGGAFFVLGLTVAVVVLAVVSLALERGLFRFTLTKTTNGFLISLGLVLILENGLARWWTVNPQLTSPPFPGVFQSGDIIVPKSEVLTIAATIAVVVALYLFLYRSRFGLALRAASVDREMVGVMGIGVPVLIIAVFVISGMLAGIAGAFLAISYPLTPTIGGAYVLKAFAVALIGGLGSITGALLAAVILAVAEAATSALGYANWVSPITFGLMIFILLLRPQGLLAGVEGRVD